MRLNDEPGATIRALIGDTRADELGNLAFSLHREHGFSTEELVYLGQCFDYLGWLSSHTGEEWDEAREGTDT